MKLDVDKPIERSFTNEWSILHNDHEKQERYSLLIKLVAVIVSFFAFAFEVSPVVAAFFIAIIWLQDGIWKTFQSRVAERILLVERCIKAEVAGESDEVHFQFYTDWEKKLKGVKRLIAEYSKNSLRPTVAYPYVVLILIQVLLFFV